MFRFKKKKKKEDVVLSGHDYYMDAQWRYFIRRSETIATDTKNIFLGDSLINMFCVESVFNGINMGISGMSVKYAKDKINQILNLDNQNIFLLYGINDFPKDVDVILADYIELLSKLPQNSKKSVISVLPIDELLVEKIFDLKKKNEQITLLNKKLKEYVENQPNMNFIDVAHAFLDEEGKLCSKYHIGDGLHLNKDGYSILSQKLSEAFDVVK